MAGLVLGAAGAAAGFMIGGPMGAQIGFMLGSSLGSSLGPGQHTEGPRLGDRTVSSSTLGTPMTTLYGASRLAGNVIACLTPLREISHTQSVGKGGPKNTQTTYTYNTDIAIDLCAGVAAGIRKIWMDGKLVYDVSAAASGSTVIASSIHAKGFTFYPGDETQLADPTLEAIFGAGQVPAYRGRCYVVFAQLDCPNGRIPQLTFEVVKTAASATPAPEYATVASTATAGARAALGKDRTYQFDAGSAPTAQYIVGSGYYQGPLLGSQLYVAGNGQTAPIPVQGGPYSMCATFDTSFYSDPMHVWYRDLSLAGGSMLPILSYRPGSDGNALRPLYAAYDPISGAFCAVAAHSTSSTGRNSAITILPSGQMTDQLGTYEQPMAFYDSVIYCIDYSGANAVLRTYDGTSGAQIGTGIPGPACGGATFYGLVHVDAGGIFVLENPPSNQTVNRRVWKVDPVALTWTLLTSTARFNNLAAAVTTWYCCDTYALVGPCAAPGGTFISAPTAHYLLIPFAAFDSVSPGVASIISAECQRAGLSAGQIDVSGLSDTVAGYPITRASSARGNIEPLLKAFFIDPVEVDGVLRFLKRANQVQVATIAFDDLAATNGGGAIDPLPLVRTQEIDLPRSVTVQYIDINTDYQVGAEQAIRQVTASVNDVADDIAICTISDHAKQVADVELFDAWSVRNKRTGALTRKYAYVTPGDIVLVEYPIGTLQARQLTRVNDTGSLIEFDAIDANAELYQTTPLGSAVGSGQTVDPPPAPTLLQVLDVPLLRDKDDFPGAYVAMAGVAASWRGAELYIGNSSSELKDQGGVGTPCPMGPVDTALGNWTLGTIDETNLLTVSVGANTLSSSTRDAVIGGAVNVCALGAPGRWEILQFIRAAALGNGKYTLSGFKRGLLGTEQYAGTHAVGDTFVLLVGGGLLKPQFQASDLNVTKQFEAVTQGSAQSTASPVAGVDTGVSLKPLSPVWIRGAIQTDGLHISWGRRTRLSSNWLVGSIPLGESKEGYTITISNPSSGAVIRTDTPASPSYLYTKQAQQSDKPPANVLVSVAQHGTLLALGLAGSATLACGFGSTAQISTITFGGAYQDGQEIKLSIGSWSTTYTTSASDGNLNGLATNIAALISTSPSYTATASGAVVTITGKPGYPFSLTVNMSGTANFVIGVSVTASGVQAGTRGESLGLWSTPITGTWPSVESGTAFSISVTNNIIRRTYSWNSFAGAQRSDVVMNLLALVNATTDPADFDFLLYSGATGESFVLDSPVGQLGWALSGYCFDSRITMFNVIQSLAQEYVPVARPQKSMAFIYGTPVAGMVFTASLGSYTYSYTAAGGDTGQTVGNALIAAINAGGQFTANNAFWDSVFTAMHFDIIGNTAAVPFAATGAVTAGAMTAAVAKVQPAS